MSKTRWFVVSIGKLINKEDFNRFSFIAPSYAKKIIGINVFSPELANQKPLHEDIHLSLLINNEEKIIVSKSFSLGFGLADDNLQVGKMLEINEEIKKGERISGYVERLCFTDRIPPFEVKLHFKCEEHSEQLPVNNKKN